MLEDKINDFSKKHPLLVNLKGEWINNVLTDFAEEQQKIDIEKAWNWFISEVEKGNILLSISHDVLLTEFTQAMED